MKYFVHIKLAEDATLWQNEALELSHCPAVGDSISFTANGPVYRVVDVLHNYFECDYPVEIYAVLTQETH